MKHKVLIKTIPIIRVDIRQLVTVVKVAEVCAIKLN